MEERINVIVIKFRAAFFEFFCKSRLQPIVVMVDRGVEIRGVVRAVSSCHRGEIGDRNRKLICARGFQDAVPGILPIVTGNFGIGWRNDESIAESSHLLYFLVRSVNPLKKFL